MTSTRRQARATSSALVEGMRVPRELLDPDHPTWQDRASTLAFVGRYGLDYREPAADRLGKGTHPHNRRNRAAQAWAEAHGITTTHQAGGHPFADLHHLAAMGLYGRKDI